jgi:hypothetical protein
VTDHTWTMFVRIWRDLMRWHFAGDGRGLSAAVKRANHIRSMLNLSPFL